MDKPVVEGMADTNMIEVKKLLHYLVTNGYKFQGTREVIYDRRSYPHDATSGSYPDDAIADFSKALQYTSAYDDINDSKIRVSIHFEKRADYTNQREDNEYVGDPERFIRGLIEEIKPSNTLVKNEGGKKRGKKRKTKKRQKLQIV